MKKLLYFALAFVAITGFVACGDDKDDDKKSSGSDTTIPGDSTTTSTVTTGKTYGAAEFVDTISMVNLKGEATVADYNARESWAQFIAIPAIGGQTPMAVLAGQPNTQTEQREMTFTATDKLGNKYIYKVTQLGKTYDDQDPGTDEPKEDIDNTTNTNVDTPNDQESDQPAFGRR